MKEREANLLLVLSLRLLYPLPTQSLSFLYLLSSYLVWTNRAEVKASSEWDTK